MSGMNLRAAFTLGLDSSIAAVQVFTNRVAEVAAFDNALEALTTTLASADISPVIDRSAPRRNVLVYFGVGGIGKTTLSRELERRYLDGVQHDRGHRVAVRVDFAEPFDLESYMLRLRAGLTSLATTQWPAFDLAFSVYWERAHPGEPLEEFLNHDSTLRRAARTIGLSDQISSTVSDIIGSAGGAHASTRLAGLLYNQARQAIVRNRTLRDCELLAQLMDADADQETLSYFPYLLAWDLDRAGQREPRAVIFLDTFEEVTSRATREMERWLIRSAFLMPNMLFVITGRNRVEWADLDRSGEIDFGGPNRWPLLQAGQVNGEPRQHLVGYLSDRDARSYLETVLTRDGSPAIPASIREQIIAAGGGLPLYLDLGVTTYLDILGQGRIPTHMDFGQPLPAVVGRILRDLDRDERDLLRAASLVDGFDLHLLRAACPHVPDAVLRRFRDRPFLEVDPDRTWCYSLHRILRDAVREADLDLRDSWSPRERAAAAGRIAAHLDRLAASAASTGDRSTEIAALRQGIALGALTNQFFDWLVDAAQRLLTSGNWNLPVGIDVGDNQAIAGLLGGIKGARERRTGHADASITQLDIALGHPDLPQNLRRFLLLHRAHALRVAGRYAEAAADYTILVQPSGSFSQEAGYWLADYHFLNGRFDDALRALEQLSDVSAHLRGEILRLRGHIFRVNALFDRAENTYRQALELARQNSNPAAEGKALTDIVQTLSWHRPHEVRDLYPLAAQINESIRNQVELVKLHAAHAVALTTAGNLDAATVEIESGITLTQQCGYPGGLIWCSVARTFNLVARADTAAGRDAAGRAAEIADELGGNRFWGEIAGWWTGTIHNPAISTTHWIDGHDAAMTRWQAVAPGR